jgi:beta-galactosidase
MCRLSGIFRNIYLFAAPHLHIRDCFVMTDLVDLYQDGNLIVQVELKNYGKNSANEFSLNRSFVKPIEKHTIIRGY